LDVIKIDRAILVHPIVSREYDFAGDIPDRRGYGGNGDLSKKLERRIPREYQNRPALVGRPELVPTHLSSLHH
jgi:hypothetical protein